MRRPVRPILCVLMAAILFALSGFPCFADEPQGGVCGRELRWTLSPDGTFTVDGTGAMTDYHLTDHHWNGEEHAIRAVRIGEDCTYVGDYAFQYCRRMTALSLPSTAGAVGCGAFMNCAALGELSLPDIVSVCGQNCFQNCLSLRAAYTGKRLRAVPFAMFAGCVKLEKVFLPSTVRVVNAFAFLSCDSLTDVYFGGTQAQWDAIALDTRGNGALTRARLHTGAAKSDLDGPSRTPTRAPAVRSGDVNGDGRVTAFDARLALRLSARLNDSGDLYAADLDGDGRATAAEARRILRMSAGLA